MPPMLGFREGWRSFKEGLDKRHIGEYWKAAWGHAWEIWWGAGVIGLICTALTLYYSPSRWILGWIVAWVFLVAGYYVWRTDHIRLVPRFEIRCLCSQHTPTIDGAGNVTGSSLYVQLEPRCLTEAEIEECQGHLKRVMKWSNNGWMDTSFNEPLLLFWSHLNQHPIVLHPGIERRLNVFHIHTSNKIITPLTDPIPLRTQDVFIPRNDGSPEAFRFDIKVTAKECPDVDVSLFVQLTNDPFNPDIKLRQSGEPL